MKRARIAPDGSDLGADTPEYASTRLRSGTTKWAR